MTTLADVLDALPIRAIESALLDGIAEQLGAPVPHAMQQDEQTGEYTVQTPLRHVTGPLDLGWLAVTVATNLAAIAAGSIDAPKPKAQTALPMHAEGSNVATACGLRYADEATRSTGMRSLVTCRDCVTVLRASDDA